MEFPCHVMTKAYKTRRMASRCREKIITQGSFSSNTYDIAAGQKEGGTGERRHSFEGPHTISELRVHRAPQMSQNNRVG